MEYPTQDIHELDFSEHVPRRTQHAGSRPFSVFLPSRGNAEQNKTQLSSPAPQHISSTERLTAQLTYTFVNIPPDADESVGQRAGATLVLRLRGGVVAEHPFHIETQHKVQETACLTILREKEREVRWQLSLTQCSAAVKECTVPTVTHLCFLLCNMLDTNILIIG